MGEPILVVKASGEREEFYPEKLRRSLQGAGASADAIDRISGRIQAGLRDGMTTAEIYRDAFSMLKKEGRHFAARYSLRRAIMDLGPTGHPFEKFVGEILKTQGYVNVQVAKMVQGMCVAHEVDIVAEKENRRIMVELKFHNAPGIRTDIKVALYVQARFEDIVKRWNHEPSHGIQFHEAWLMTNTKLTSEAIAYGKCVGMNVIGWNYPSGGSLRYLVERSGLHPITSLTTLTKVDKAKLLDRGFVICTDLKKDGNVLMSLGLSETKLKEVVKEIDELCIQRSV